MPILINVTGYSDAAGGTVVFRWSNGTGYHSGPFDFPQNTTWEPRIINPGTYERHCFGRGRIRGRSDVAYGQIEINNADGALDHLLDDVGFAGWPLEIRRGPKRGRYPDDFPILFTGTVAGVEPNGRRIVFRIRDRQEEIAEKLVVPATFKGDNALPDGLEGTADDIKGRNKSHPWGIARNVTLTCCNTSKRIFQVGIASSGTAGAIYQSIVFDAVWDDGAPILADPAGGTYATLADLQDNAQAPAEGKRKVYVGADGVYVRTGSDPVGALTATIIEGNSDLDRTRGQLMKRLLMGPGEVPAGQVLGAEKIDRQSPAVAGIWAGPDGLKVGDALDALSSDGIWWMPSRDGRIHLGMLEAPSGEPVAEFGAHNILGRGDAMERIVSDDEGLPLHALQMEHQKNWTVQDESSLADVALPDKLWRGKEYRITDPVAADEVLRKYPLLVGRDPLKLTTLLDREADALAERDRIMTRDRVRRDIWVFKTWSTEAAAVDPADPNKNLIRVTLPRYVFKSGWLGRCIGMVEDLSRNVTTLFAWG